jgi:hypothetical protein
MANEVETHDVVSVGSRVSWGAIFAGAFVALTLCIFFGVLGAALNLSIADTTVRGETLATGAGIWTIATLLVALFVGGFVTSRTTVGERKGEAMMYGVLVWAVLMSMTALAAGAGAGASYGLNGYLQQSTTAVTQPRFQQALQVTPEQAEVAKLTPQQRENLNKQLAEGQATARDMSATAMSWWAFAGIGISLFAAIAGALVGAGPELVLRHWTGRRVIVTQPPPHA